MPTVLIVDRLQQRGELLAQRLERHGWDAIVTSSVADARHAGGQIRMHVVLVDETLFYETEVPVEAGFDTDAQLARTPLVYLAETTGTPRLQARRVLARDSAVEHVHAALIAALQESSDVRRRR